MKVQVEENKSKFKNNKIRLAIIGSGMIARVVAKAILKSENAIFAGIASRNPANARRLLQEVGGNSLDVRVFDSWQDLLQSDQVDAVYIATPTNVKHEIAIASLEAGKHLLIDKPLASMESLNAISHLAQEQNLTVMDATHFVHHPRTKSIKEAIVKEIGVVRHVRTAFHFPVADLSNIRFDPTKEPLGAIGDLAWYNMRAIVEFLGTEGELTGVKTHAQRDPETGAVIAASGSLCFSDGKSSTWSVGLRTNAVAMDLDIIGDGGTISVDDFVLDKAFGFAFNNPDVKVGYEIRQGHQLRGLDSKFVHVANDTPAEVRMIDTFATEIVAGSQASIAVTRRNQELVSRVWESIGK